jgi:hypothetical protein
VTIQNPNDPETQKQFAAFAKGQPVSNEFLAELAERTGYLLTELQNRGWNPDEASRGMTELFQKANQIFQQPHNRGWKPALTVCKPPALTPSQRPK